MKTPLSKKSTIREIEDRFNLDVERFADLETGQQATIDAPLSMELITQAAIASTKNIQHLLDIGCGAGNNTLKMLQLVNPLDCDLVDLSQPMLNRAVERLRKVNTGGIRSFQGDFRNTDLPDGSYDVIIAASVLHHLRDDKDWENVFQKIYSLTAPKGSVWITDMVCHESSAVHDMMWHRYGGYLKEMGGEAYREKVFTYIDKEDSPRPVTFQLDLLQKVGFSKVDILHKNSCFAAFGGVKSC